MKKKKPDLNGDEQSNTNKNDKQNDSRHHVPSEIDEFEKLFRKAFFNSSDVVIDVFQTSKEKAMMVYIDGMINNDITDRDIIMPLKSSQFTGDVGLAIAAKFQTTKDIPEAVTGIINGKTAIFYDNCSDIYIVDMRQWEKRSIETPDSETVIRGPKEGFTENLRTNTVLIRRKIRNPALVFEDMLLGVQTNTSVTLVYIQGIVNQDVLTEARKRLSQMNTDSILESGYIEQFIDHNTFSPVSGIGVTQKPDVAAGRILEGRVAILCDGTPHALTIPELFMDNLHTSEDYYNRTLQSSIVRIFRFIGLLIGTLLPGLSVAFMTYNPETIPAVFLTRLISSTQRTPLPSAAEAFFLILMFELLRESGTRLPKTIGSAITIVGSLIIGQAAVEAGIVGAPMVIIIALTAVSSFIIPNLAEFVLIYRLYYLLLGATMGLIGIGIGIITMLTQLISTESFGIPILSSFSKSEWKDSIIRFPLFHMKKRPVSIAKTNVTKTE